MGGLLPICDLMFSCEKISGTFYYFSKLAFPSDCGFTFNPWNILVVLPPLFTFGGSIEVLIDVLGEVF